MKKCIYLLACGTLFMSCNLQNSTSIRDAKYEVSINPNESKTLNFSKTTDFIKYVPLETTKESLIKHVEKMFITDSLIIILMICWVIFFCLIKRENI